MGFQWPLKSHCHWNIIGLPPLKFSLIGSPAQDSWFHILFLEWNIYWAGGSSRRDWKRKYNNHNWPSRSPNRWSNHGTRFRTGYRWGWLDLFLEKEREKIKTTNRKWNYQISSIANKITFASSNNNRARNSCSGWSLARTNFWNAKKSSPVSRSRVITSSAGFSVLFLTPRYNKGVLRYWQYHIVTSKFRPRLKYF